VSYSELDLHCYVRDLEEHLKLTLFGGGASDPEAAVLLVRGALAAGDESRAAELAAATERLAAIRPGDPGLRTAAAHVRGLVEQSRTRHRTRASRPAFGWDSLTDTERRIVDLVAQGLSNREAASQMFLSRHTVSFHLRSIFRKLDVTSRVQLARVAADRHWTGAGEQAGTTIR
jgi:DNA-binding CsgD family transcriptional regulator